MTAEFGKVGVTLRTRAREHRIEGKNNWDLNITKNSIFEAAFL